jgi:hypothetical protein
LVIFYYPFRYIAKYKPFLFKAIRVLDILLISDLKWNKSICETNHIIFFVLPMPFLTSVKADHLILFTFHANEKPRQTAKFAGVFIYLYE